MNWYMIKTKDTYVSKLCILFHIFDLFNFFNSCEVRSGVGLWLVNTYQYGCHPSVLSHRALGTAECDESNEGGPYLVVGVRGILLPWVTLRREGRHDHIWISNILWRQFRGGLCPYRAYGRGIPLYGNAATPQVFRVPKTDHSLLLVNTESIPKCGIVSTVSLCRHNFILQSWR